MSKLLTSANLSVIGALLFLTPTTYGHSLAFPKDFWWGTSLSAHQAEGGNHNTWTEWESKTGTIRNGEKSGRAADHWNLYQDDFSHLNWLNANTHRLSIEWSRVEPSEGVWDEEAIQHYRSMFKTLHKLGIRPVVCLFHFTLPIWFGQKGGFEKEENLKYFVEFAAKMATEYHDLVSTWLTINEPAVYALAAYGAGVTPPGVNDPRRALDVIAGLMRAHARAYHAIKRIDPTSQISFAHHLRVFVPKHQWWPPDQFFVHVVDQNFNWAWFEALQKGEIDLSVPLYYSRKEKCDECLNALDFIGFNYYGRDTISVMPGGWKSFFLAAPESSILTDMGWEIFPEGLREILFKIKQRGLDQYPLLITENGIADAQDSRRPLYIYKHLSEFLSAAEEFNLKPMGYLYWSLIDNFEWIDGYYPRFGLFAVDYKTYRREPRRSAYYFRHLGEKKQVLPPDHQLMSLN